MQFRTLPSLAAVLVLSAPAAAQDLDGILANFYEARGGLERIKSVNTMRVTGTMTMGPGMEAPVTLELKRPDRMRMEFVFQGMTGIQAYDGEGGWSLIPFGGRKDPQPMAPEELEEARKQADIDGPLVDWKEKGHTVELVGEDTVEGAPAWKLKVTLDSGDVEYHWLDAEYYLPLKEEAQRTIRGSDVETETSYGDYKEVEGLMLPFAIEGGPKGRPERQKLVIEKVEVNVPIDDERFAMPAAEPAETPQG